MRQDCVEPEFKSLIMIKHTPEPFNSQIKFVILLSVNHTIIMLVQGIQYWINLLSPN